MEQKECTKCGKIKLVTEFKTKKNKKTNKVYVCNLCLQCHKDYCKAYTRIDPLYLKQYNDTKKELRRQQKYTAVEYLGNKCSMCGGQFHISAYDFHHKDPDKKDMDVGLLLQRDWIILKNELDKCILLCANCHRKLHYEEGTLGRIKRDRQQLRNSNTG